mgnify:CR=1 FL=1
MKSFLKSQNFKLTNIVEKPKTKISNELFVLIAPNAHIFNDIMCGKLVIFERFSGSFIYYIIYINESLHHSNIGLRVDCFYTHTHTHTHTLTLTLTLTLTHTHTIKYTSTYTNSPYI